MADACRFICTTKRYVRPAKTPGHLPSLIRVFAVLMKKHWVLSYPLSAQRRLIRPGECPGWYESSLGTQVILLVLSCCGSYHATMVEIGTDFLVRGNFMQLVTYFASLAEWACIRVVDSWKCTRGHLFVSRLQLYWCNQLAVASRKSEKAIFSFMISFLEKIKRGTKIKFDSFFNHYS